VWRVGGGGLVRDPGCHQPAVAARDEAEEVVALEEVRAARRGRSEIVPGEKREPQVPTQTEIHGAIELVHAGGRHETRILVPTHALVHVLLDEPIGDAERARALVARRAGDGPEPGFPDEAAHADA